jgi:hypothetical protein
MRQALEFKRASTLNRRRFSSAMSGGTCASATLEADVSANSAATKKRWCILPFDVSVVRLAARIGRPGVERGTLSCRAD